MSHCSSDRCHQGRRLCPTPVRCGARLTEAHLDRQIEAKTETRPLPELLLAKGVMTGPHKRTRPITRWRLFVDRIAANVTYFLHP